KQLTVNLDHALASHMPDYSLIGGGGACAVRWPARASRTRTRCRSRQRSPMGIESELQARLLYLRSYQVPVECSGTQQLCMVDGLSGRRLESLIAGASTPPPYS